MPDARSDGDLVAAARTGNTSAFAVVIERHHATVFALARAMSGSRAQGEEITQETFSLAWARLHRLREPDRLRSWLCGIARFAGRRSRFERGRHRADDIGARELPTPSEDPSPLDRLIDRETEAALASALAATPDAYRVPLLLFYREQQSARQIAEALSISEQNVKQRLSRGRRLLHQKLAAKLDGGLTKTVPPAGMVAAVLAAISAAGARAAEAARAPRVGAVTPLFLAVGVVMVLVPPRIPPRHSHADASSAAVAERGSRGFATAPPLVSAAPLAPVEVAPRTAADLPTLFQLDFEDGLLPSVLEAGYVGAAPPGWSSRFCATGVVQVSWPVAYVVRIGQQGAPLFHYADGLVLSFDYWVGGEYIETEAVARRRAAVLAEDPDLGDNTTGPIPISVSIRDLDRSQNHAFYIRRYTPETWGHAEVPLRALSPPPGGARLESGDPIGAITLDGGRTGGKPFLVDNVRLIAAPRTGP